MKAMQALIAPTLALILACAPAAPEQAKHAREDPLPAASPAGPVVVELYQSQGCSSCPPANANVNAIVDDPGILALSFAVTYWDRLGWTDRFGKEEFTRRQRDYAKAHGRKGGVYTPQIVVNGGAPIVGNNADELRALIEARGAPAGGPEISAANGSVVVSEGDGAATVWLVRYDPRTLDVPVGAGENAGRTLPHRNIVRSLDRLGDWSGKAAQFAVPPAKDPAWRSAVLVQQEPGGAVIAAAKL